MFTAIALFLSPFLYKAGEKVLDKTIETLFDSRKDLADKFLDVFKPEFQTLGLSESSTTEEIAKQLEAKPEVKEAIRAKVEANQDLVTQLTEALSKQEGRTITCKTYIEKIEHIDTANFS
jgi:hypothetical protein